MLAEGWSYSQKHCKIVFALYTVSALCIPKLLLYFCGFAFYNNESLFNIMSLSAGMTYYFLCFSLIYMNRSFFLSILSKTRVERMLKSWR